MAHPSEGQPLTSPEQFNFKGPSHFPYDVTSDDELVPKLERIVGPKTLKAVTVEFTADSLMSERSRPIEQAISIAEVIPHRRRALLGICAITDHAKPTITIHLPTAATIARMVEAQGEIIEPGQPLNTHLVEQQITAGLIRGYAFHADKGNDDELKLGLDRWASVARTFGPIGPEYVSRAVVALAIRYPVFHNLVNSISVTRQEQN